MNKQLFLASFERDAKKYFELRNWCSSIFMVVNLDIPFNGISERFK